MKISEIKELQNEAAVNEVSVTIKKVYERKANPRAPQNALIEDSSGIIKLSVWSHPDIAKLEGKQVVIHANSAGAGLFVKHNDFKKDQPPIPELHINKSGQFHLVETYQNRNQAPEKASGSPDRSGSAFNSPANAPSGQNKTIHGATAGAATNKAVDLLIAKGIKGLELHQIEEQLWKIGSAVARVAMRIESGDLAPSRAQQEEAAHKKLDNTSPASNQAVADEDVPF